MCDLRGSPVWHKLHWFVDTFELLYICAELWKLHHPILQGSNEVKLNTVIWWDDLCASVYTVLMYYPLRPNRKFNHTVQIKHGVKHKQSWLRISSHGGYWGVESHLVTLDWINIVCVRRSDCASFWRTEHEDSSGVFSAPDKDSSKHFSSIKTELVIDNSMYSQVHCPTGLMLSWWADKHLLLLLLPATSVWNKKSLWCDSCSCVQFCWPVWPASTNPQTTVHHCYI